MEFCPTLGAFKKIYEKMIAIKVILIVCRSFQSLVIFFFKNAPSWMFDMVLNTYLYSTLESNRFNLNLVVEFCPTLGAFKKIYEKMIAIKLILIVIEVFSRYLFFFFSKMYLHGCLTWS